jgi:multidrug resistance efflux pump
MNRLFAFAIGTMLLAACTTEEPAPEPAHTEGGSAAPTNRIDVPPAVRRNLGIEFGKVELRRVDRTIRLPGSFEVPPESQRVYRAPLGGRVSFKMTQYSQVKAGDEIATIASSEWRAMQRELGGLDTAVVEGKAELAVARTSREAAEADIAMYPRRISAYDPRLEVLEAHHRNLEATRDLWQKRLTELEELAAKNAARASELTEARSQLAEAVQALSGEEEVHADLHREIEMLKLAEEAARNNLPSLKAEEDAAAARVTAAEKAYDLALRGAASMLDLPYDAVKGDAWREIDAIPVRASAPGVLMDWHASEGELVEAGEQLGQVMDHRRLRFRARGLQADMSKLREGLQATVLPPAGVTATEPATGVIALAPMADADVRLVDVVMTLEHAPQWARPGLSAELEIVWDPAAEPTLAIPNKALIRDGLDVVFFRRDSADPDKVVRLIAELGATDGRWTVIHTGVMEGSEVVTEGTYELKLTGAGKNTLKGHFHADGTFHAEGTPEPGGH